MLGFSEFIKKDELGIFHFTKKPFPKDFLTQDISFFAEHIPADPIWQLTPYPMSIDTLIANGNNSKIDSNQQSLDFEK